MSLVDRIRAANELVSIYDFIESVSDTSQPRQILCPVHDDTRRSARVYPESNSVYCWTCARAYDPVAILVETEGLSLSGACQYIEDNAGVKYELQKRTDEEFWNLVKKARSDPDDPELWSRRDRVKFRWAAHRTVLNIVDDPAKIDWSGFDNAHLDIAAIRVWSEAQLDDSH